MLERIARIAVVLSAMPFVGALAAAAELPELAAVSRDPSTAQYSDVQKFMRGLAVKYPKNAQLFTLGESDSGQMIEGLAIGTGSVHHLVVGTHHGNEYGATEVARAVAANLAANPIEGQTVYVIPVLNIAGYNAKERREPAKGDADGVDHDPNRDYPGPCGTDGPWHLKDTRALAQFIDDRNIVGSSTLHTFSPAVVYPWGISTHDLSTPYDGLFQQLVREATVESQYPTGNNTQLIYPADGTFEDYAFWKHGIWSILFELGDTHTPDAAGVKELVKVNTPGIRRLLENTPKERAEKHAFTGKCDTALRILDRRDE